jgi:hypothetical protein
MIPLDIPKNLTPTTATDISAIEGWRAQKEII